MDWANKLFRPLLARLGEDATYTPSGGGGSSTVRVLYQEPFQNILGTESTDPMLGVMSADVPNLARGDTFMVRGTTFTVKSPRPDIVTGHSLATLEK